MGSTRMPRPEELLPGRSEPMPVAAQHVVLGTPLTGPFPDELARLVVGMGCFWGAERAFWSLPGVFTTFVGYAGGGTANPTYREVCSGRTGHTEVVGVLYDPEALSLDTLLHVFWERHDPTQGMRQGNDLGTQYRSALYLPDVATLAHAERSRDAYQRALHAAGLGDITTELRLEPAFYYAEDDHQQYLAKVPDGYCGLAGTGVQCPVGVGVIA